MVKIKTEKKTRTRRMVLLKIFEIDSGENNGRPGLEEARNRNRASIITKQSMIPENLKWSRPERISYSRCPDLPACSGKTKKNR